MSRGGGSGEVIGGVCGGGSGVGGLSVGNGLQDYLLFSPSLGLGLALPNPYPTPRCCPPALLTREKRSREEAGTLLPHSLSALQFSVGLPQSQPTYVLLVGEAGSGAQAL